MSRIPEVRSITRRSGRYRGPGFQAPVDNVEVRSISDVSDSRGPVDNAEVRSIPGVSDSKALVDNVEVRSISGVSDSEVRSITSRSGRYRGRRRQLRSISGAGVRSSGRDQLHRIAWSEGFIRDGGALDSIQAVGAMPLFPGVERVQHNVAVFGLPERIGLDARTSSP